jgi:hypothetical protein
MSGTCGAGREGSEARQGSDRSAWPVWLGGIHYQLPEAPPRLSRDQGYANADQLYDSCPLTSGASSCQ